MLTVTNDVVTLLRSRAEEAPDGGYQWLDNGAPSASLSYQALDRDARAVAVRLQSAGISEGDPVLLLYPPGLDFHRAFFGTLYAGAAAVPLNPPNPARLAQTLPRIQRIAADSGARVILTTAAMHRAAEALFAFAPELVSFTWIATDVGDSDASAWRDPEVDPASLALLQYTSGSTREPRGVMITHGNLMHNLQLVRGAFNHRERDLRVVSWLPVYHDMGLIGMLLQPVLCGGSCTMMSPLDFLRNPLLWLRAISQTRAHTSGAPNFAYDLCVRKVTDEQLSSLDLSSLEVTYCGAEPIRKATLDAFAAKFERCGFKSRTYLPCYGLAEATLIVSGQSRPEGAFSVQVSDAELRKGRMSPVGEGGTSLVSCGPICGDQDVAIVRDGARCARGEVGEIWVRGGSVGTGYWRNAKETAQTFKAYIGTEGPYMRTGDLGALDERGELYVVGRVKDLIIVRGLNHYPHDLERAAEEAWPALRPGCSVAFALEDAGDDFAIVCEYNSRGSNEGVAWDPVVQAIRTAIAAEHDVAPKTVVIVDNGQVPKTPSGKVQRSETRQKLRDAALKVLHRWDAPESAPEVVADVPMQTPGEIAAFMASWLSEVLARPVAATARFSALGIDSLEIVNLVEILSKRLGKELDPVLAIDYPSIDALAEHLAKAD